ncbi:glycosyltransferase [Methanospirillum sp.]|uniref:glycosyltransferase n=1 Tax=Methanospirillum sp. TaxID=45200 RepID=UPI001BD2A809|nr:glycosyltransferase [Methanospirillum sp.]
MKKIAIISLSNLIQDPRVFRQIDALKQDYKIITAGLTSSGIPEIPFFQLEFFGKKIYQRSLCMKLTKNYENFYWNYGNLQELGQYLRKEEPDIIIANDIDMLPVAIQNKGYAKVIFDAHEYSPLENDESLLFRLLFKPYKEWLVKNYVHKADSMMTVSEGIADQYFKDTGVKSTIITNAPQYQDLYPSYVDENKIKLVHHGGAHPSRNLESHIEIMKYLDRKKYEFHFYLMPTVKKYYNQIIEIGSKYGNIFFHDPIPMLDLPKTLNQYDIGVYLFPPTNFNNKYALPNKFFEFIQGRLAIAIGPSPEMAKIVKKYELGVVSDDFQPSKMAELIQNLTTDMINRYKKNSHSASKFLSADNNMQLLKSMIMELLY